MRTLLRAGIWPAVICAHLVVGASAQARIKLITLPVRERVEIQLDHPNTTLVEEERIVPLVKGQNQVDFSWANTRIDPNTIVFRVIGSTGKNPIDVNVLSVSYPPNENALVWQVWASGSGSARVRISYVLGGLTKSFHYRAVAANDEKTLTLMQYLRIQNFANERFGSSGVWAGYGERLLKPIGINETKQILIHKTIGVPVTKTYTCDAKKYGYVDRAQNKLRVPMHYVLTNNKAHNLGAEALPYGKVRIFQDDGQGTVAFLGEDWSKFTPIDDQTHLYLGVARDIVVKRTIDRNVTHRVAGNLYTQEVVVKYEIENFKDAPAVLDVSEDLRHLRGEVRRNSGRDVQWRLGEKTTFPDGPDKEKTTHEQLVFHVPLPARDKADIAAGKAEKLVYKLHLFIENEW